jgi:gamma-glutamyl-gamma-aminobutyrate hydrolase PuuD
MRTKNIFSAFLLILFVSASAEGQIKIALSKASLPTYENWLKGADPDVVVVNMYGLTIDSALKSLETCSGLLVTGGEDVNPVIYGKGDELAKCEAIDHYRDTLEIALIKKAYSLKMPIFGICRGEQILNVAFGGSLFTDIPTDKGTKVIHRDEGIDGSPHGVNIEKESEVCKILGVQRGIANSYHHQAVDKIAPGFRVAATSADGVVEAIEALNISETLFIMGVQWHPEKSTQNAELSKLFAVHFLNHVKSYKALQR